MIVKNMSENIIIHIFVNEISREIIRDFSRRKKSGKSSRVERNRQFFEEIKYDHSLHNYNIYRGKEYGLENLTNMHDCIFTTTLLEASIEVERRRINKE